MLKSISDFTQSVKSTREKQVSFSFNLVCIYIFLLYQTLTAMILHFDMRGRFVSLAVIVCTIYNLRHNKLWRKLLMSKPIIIWTIWCVFTTINTVIHGHKNYKDINDLYIIWNDDIFYLQIIFRQLIVMTTICYLYIQNKKILIKHMVIIFLCTAVFTLLFDTNREDWGGENRFGSIMGNSAALMMVSFIFLLLITWKRRYLNQYVIIAATIIAISLILAIQTRKAFIAIIIILIFAYLTHIKVKNPLTWILLPLGILIINIATDYIIDNTSIGSRLANIDEQGDSSNITGIPLLNFLGDRAMHVYLGWKIWLEHPIFGVGLQNAPYYSHLPFVFHQEYIGQLAENGIIGFILLITFYYLILRNIITNILTIKKSTTINLICIGYVVAILFISLTAWTYQFPHYFAMFGIIIGESISQHYIYNKYAKNCISRIPIRRRKRTKNGRINSPFI